MDPDDYYEHTIQYFMVDAEDPIDSFSTLSN